MKNRPKGNFWFQESSAALIKKKKDEVSPSTGTSTKWLFSLGWEDGSEEVCASLPYLVPDRLLTSPKGTGARKERLTVQFAKCGGASLQQKPKLSAFYEKVPI